MKNLLTIIALCAAVLSASTVEAQTKVEVQKKFNEAATKLNEKKFADAIPLFEQTIALTETSEDDVVSIAEESNKHLTTCYFYSGAMSAKKGDFAAAIDLFAKAKDLASMTGNMTMENKVSAMMGNVYIVQGNKAIEAQQPDKAAEFYNTAYLANNKNTQAGLLAAQSYAKAGNMARSTEIYKELIALESVHSKYKTAAEEAKKAFSNTLLAAASVAATENNFAEVSKNVDEILAVVPAHPQAMLIRVQAASNGKKANEVIKYGADAAAAQTDGVAKSNIYFMIGAAYQGKEDKDNAIKAYSQVTEGDNVATAKDMITALSKK